MKNILIFLFAFWLFNFKHQEIMKMRKRIIMKIEDKNLVKLETFFRFTYEFCE